MKKQTQVKKKTYETILSDKRLIVSMFLKLLPNQ